MSSDKTPLESAVDQALDAFVYAPIGLLLDGPALFPKLVEQGKNQVQVARMMGQMTVQMGQSELTKRADATDGPIRDVLAGIGLASPVTPEAPADPAPASAKKPAPKKAPAKKAASKKKTSTKKWPAKKSTAKKSTAKKSTAKKSAANKAQPKQKTASAPAGAGLLGIADYDSLSASQVVSRLRGLVPDELDAVKAYESANRARKTVLNKIVQLQKG